MGVVRLFTYNRGGEKMSNEMKKRKEEPEDKGIKHRMIYSKEPVLEKDGVIHYTEYVECSSDNAGSTQELFFQIVTRMKIDKGEKK